MIVRTEEKTDRDRSQPCIDEIHRLASAMIEGHLEERADAERFSGSDYELLNTLNSMLDALISPLKVAAKAIAQIAHGTIPDFIIEEYKGEFNDIKRDLNTFLAVMYGMHYETRNLIKAIKKGELNARGNDWDFEGNWQELIAGVNDTLDAVTHPVKDAQVVLEKISNFDLCARMEGLYQGDHAQIKKAINATGEVLRAALEQVSESVSQVSSSGKQITHSSQIVAQGAATQAQSIEVISNELDQISLNVRNNADGTEQARIISQQAKDATDNVKDATDKMVEAMGDIRSATESSMAIIREINTITLQTDDLALNAAQEATKVGAAARGFAVVAGEVRRLSMRSKEASVEMDDISIEFGNKDAETDMQVAAGKIVKISQEISRISLQTNLLALNAAVEAAHVGEAGHGFEKVTEEVQQLSKRSKEMASKTEELIKHSVDLAQNGEILSADINQNLADVINGVSEVTALVENIAEASKDQKRGVDIVNKSVAQMQSVMQENTASAKSSSVAAEELEKQTQKLITLVNRFQLNLPSE